MAIHGELFKAAGFAPMPGLVVVEEAISAAQETDIAARIDAAPLAPFQFGPWQGKRLSCHYGRSYDFARQRMSPAPPLPDWLLALRDQLAPQMDLASDALQAALLLRYDPGAGIGWHRDRPQYGDVVGLSLGAPAILRLRCRTATGFERCRVPLAPRSAYRLSGEARWEWEHSIAPLAVTRWSITLRALRAA